MLLIHILKTPTVRGKNPVEHPTPQPPGPTKSNSVVRSVITEYAPAKTEIVELRSTRKEYLLPTNLRPSIYQIELEPNFEDETFRGSINITFSTESATNLVVLHKEELDIDDSSISLLDEKGNRVNSFVNTSYSENDKHFYTITFKENLTEKEVYTLAIDYFTSTLRKEQKTYKGFYLGNYSDANNVQRKFATTQFEPVFARQAFPCFDEPALKAHFEITIIRPANYSSISNMPKISETEISKGRFQDKFTRSIKMSTYLVAFVISDFTNVAHLNHRVFAKPASIAAGHANFALDIGIKILNTMSEFVNLPYSLKKMDQVSIPSENFFHGAMENWGLVIYHEDTLMLNARRPEGIASIISHEFAHQWFGNLVSPIWWSYVWLNEGFARYLQYYLTSRVFEDENIMNTFVTNVVYNILNIDSGNTVTSMNHEVGSPRDVRNHLSDSYSKPASVIRMVHNIISTDVFRKGLNIYLNKMQFLAAHPQDLYNSWQQALEIAGMNPLPDTENISSVMRTWDSNLGYPLVTVHRNHNNGSVIISQRRFLRDNPNNNDESIWYVPITYTTGSNINFSVTPPKLWLTSRSMEVVLDDLNAEDWFIVNIQQTGFYRVNYANENWKHIIDVLKNDIHKIHQLNRGQLQDDAMALFRAGLLDETIWTGITQSITRETDYVPLNSFLNSLNALDTYMSNTRHYKEFKDMVTDLLDAAVNSVGFEENDNDSYITKLKRDMVLAWVCRYGRQECKINGLAKIREWNRRENKVTITNLHTTMLCAALRNGEQNDWDFVFNKYMNEKTLVLRQRLLNALSCSENEAVLEKFLDTAVRNTNQLSESDRLTLLLAVCNSGTYGRDYFYNYVKKNWREVNTSLTTKRFKSIVKCIASKLSTEKQYAEIQGLLELFESHSGFEEVLKKAQSNIDGARKFVPAISNWIAEHSLK